MSGTGVERFRQKRRLPIAAPMAAFCLIALSLVAPAPAQAAGMTLRETGSTLLYPLFQLWIRDYPGVAPGVSLTAAATGSGVGQREAMSGRAHIGASDAYMSDRQAQQNPQIRNIAVAISALTVNYNIPGLNSGGLKLDGPTLAGIYDGRITEWDAEPIKAMNPGVNLPHQAIVPIRRAEDSGDTFVFAQFLDFSTERWEDNVGYGLNVEWPGVAGERTATGNDGMVKALAATPNSVGYAGVSFRDAIKTAGLGTALVKNQNGKFVLPNAETITAGASELDSRTPPDQRLSLVFARGDRSYPLINYEYVAVSLRQPNPETAGALRHLLLWSVSLLGGNAPKYLETVGFVALPDFIRALSEKQINLIK
ncbi:MAG: phosphate ABC transporter substrate-binding protein PstS [Stellaceae bacterium]